ncbi:hypothetical protein GALMADRAFT_440828 [Galerina marginata CBS 339.88]|uniref:Uncharacterized protein n=1 Tax=Galerina marginata (strain CBS 339.88) TaxID=685588 RepID=A0A067T290_GALM3|nr:hypothetical protein GALMADRAFT_440828 [Galerina marginata CBS 339.88]
MSTHSPRVYNKQLELEDFARIAPPSHRHAAPSAPWPWVDIEDAVDPAQLASPLPPVPEPCDHISCGGCWKGYPQSLYPNWTPGQVEKSKIKKAIEEYRHDISCVIHRVDVDRNGLFDVPNPSQIVSNDKNLADTWEAIINSNVPVDNRVRALFIENMSGPVLQMLGAKYNIEPFFFSSSLNWIPSRYEEEVRPGQGDHITITLTFLRSVSNSEAIRLSAVSPYATSSASLGKKSLLADQMIDTQAPLSLTSNGRLLLLDLLSVHLIRRKHGSTIISYHADKDLPTTTAPYLHERIRFAGQSVYWQSIFQKSPDPTFVLLTFIWHAVYAWDQALENLYSHICFLETRVINTSEMALTQELHIIRAHHLHYTSLLEDFRKTVVFIRDTKNPALDSLSKTEQEFSAHLMTRECANLLIEIDRLEMGRHMQGQRLKNVMNLVFSSVNILDSKRMQKMTEAAVRDSAGMKQIAYLTMVFLPASFVAAVFGMNVKEISPDTHGTLPHYVAAALPFTLITVWIIVASQSKYIFSENVSFWKRLAWPFLLLARSWGRESFQEGMGGQNARSPAFSSISKAMQSH